MRRVVDREDPCPSCCRGWGRGGRARQSEVIRWNRVGQSRSRSSLLRFGDDVSCAHSTRPGSTASCQRWNGSWRSANLCTQSTVQLRLGSHNNVRVDRPSVCASVLNARTYVCGVVLTSFFIVFLVATPLAGCSKPCSYTFGLPHALGTSSIRDMLVVRDVTVLDDEEVYLDFFDIPVVQEAGGEDATGRVKRSKARMFFENPRAAWQVAQCLGTIVRVSPRQRNVLRLRYQIQGASF